MYFNLNDFKKLEKSLITENLQSNNNIDENENFQNKIYNVDNEYNKLNLKEMLDNNSSIPDLKEKTNNSTELNSTEMIDKNFTKLNLNEKTNNNSIKLNSNENINNYLIKLNLNEKEIADNNLSELNTTKNKEKIIVYFRDTFDIDLDEYSEDEVEFVKIEES